MGITATPVIDPNSGTIYVEAKTKENSVYFHRLHALAITTGAEKFGGRVGISTAVAGTGAGSSQGVLAFNPLWEHSRPGLLFYQGRVYVSYASHQDNPPFHGWVLGYDAAILNLVSVVNTTPNGSDGGIWQDGGGLAADTSEYLYALTGNGTFDVNLGGNDYGMAFIKMNAQAGLRIVDYFSPYYAVALSNLDKDFGSGGPILLPDEAGSAAHPHLALGGGKDGKLRVIDRDAMGEFNDFGRHPDRRDR